MNVPDKPENISVAWFKLADLIARGEREKALNVFRLLSHSYNDKAFCLQLEGDILWSLKADQQAHEKYKQAAYLYKKDSRYVHALALCKHLARLDFHDDEVFVSLLELYAVLGWREDFERQVNEIYELQAAHMLRDEQVKSIFKSARDFCSQETDGHTRTWVDKVLG